MLGGSNILLIILIVNVFILGVVIAFAVSHWHRNLRPRNISSQRELLPEEVRQQIYDEARSDYEKVLRRSAVAFGKDLDATTDDLTKQLDKLRALNHQKIPKQVRLPTLPRRLTPSSPPIKQSTPGHA